MSRILAFLALLWVGFGAGAVISHVGAWPYPQLVRRLYSPSQPVFTGDKPRVIQSQALDLVVERFPRQLRDEAGLGGGLSPYREDALLLEGDGTLSLVRIDELETVALDIAMPPSGRGAVMAPIPGDHIADYQRNFWHRYLDLISRGQELYLSYQYYSLEDACFSIRLAHVQINPPIEQVRVGPDDWEILFETQPCFPFKSTGRHVYAGHFAGGQIILTDDNLIYLTVGDFDFDGVGGPNFVQDLTKDYGKVFRIDPATRQADIFTVGHRNPQGLVQTPDGRIWSSEQGPEGGDELNVLVRGENYGWPFATYGTDYGERVWPIAERQGHHDIGRKPAWAWVPSIAPSNIAYVSDFSEMWDGALLVAALKDRALWRVVIDGDHVISTERIEFGERLRSVLVHGGYVLLYADTANLLRVSPFERRLVQ